MFALSKSISAAVAVGGRTTVTGTRTLSPKWLSTTGLLPRSRLRPRPCNVHPQGRQRRTMSDASTTTTSAPTTAASTAQASTPSVTAPTAHQLRILAFRSAIPMVGFGIMDNVVMIMAGDAIDSTFGVALGISTMAAAGLGQCFSDVAGLTSGGIVDAAVSKLNLRHHGLSVAQLDTKKARFVSTLGACVGVVTGCLIGMTVLLGIDTDKVDRARRAKELKSIFESVMNDGHTLVEAERATLFLIDEDTNELWSQVATGTDGIIKVPCSKGMVGQSVTTGTLLNVPDAYQNPHFEGSFDEKTGFKTVSVLVVPIRSKSSRTKDKEGDIIGAVQMINKRKKGTIASETGTDTIIPFTPNDEKIVKVLASHVATFIQVVEGA